MPFSYDIDPDDSSRSRRRSQQKEKQERIEYKALGANLGQLARGAVAFDPNAEDGDGDGLVQDNTPYERPAVLSNIADTVRQGLASATGSTSLFNNGFSPIQGMTNREVAEYAVPDNPARFLEMRLEQQALLRMTGDNPYIKEDLDKLSFDPEGIEQLRNLVERTLDERPALRVAWDRFGVPPVGISSGKNTYSGVYLFDSILMDDDALKAKPLRSAISNARIMNLLTSAAVGAPRIKGIKRAFVSTDARDTLTHEWGHYLQHITERLHPDSNIREASSLLDGYSWSDSAYYADKLAKYPKIKKVVDYFNNASHDYDAVNDLPDDSVPFVHSSYGATKPGEFVAEAIAAYFSPDKKTRALLNDAGAQLVEEVFLGIGRGGLASSSSGRKTTTGTSMRGLTPAEMAERIVPATLEEALLSIGDHQAMMAVGDDDKDVNIEALREAIPNGVDDLDFSPEAVKEMREVVTKALAENRMFREVAERHGYPPVLASKRGAEWIDGDDTYAVSMIEGFPSIIVNRDVRNQMVGMGDSYRNGVYEKDGMLDGTDRFLVSPREDVMMAHEWGHYINRLAATSHPDPDIRALATFWFSDTWDYDVELNKIGKILTKLGIESDDKVTRRLVGAKKFGQKVNNKESEKWTGYPHVKSQYGQSMPAEAFAEGVGAILVDDINLRDLVSPALREDIFDIIGKPTAYQRDIAGGIPERRAGFASVFMPRDTNGELILPMTATEPDAKYTPLSGRDWLKDATNEEAADALAVRGIEDFLKLTLMNMMYGKDPSLASPYLQKLTEAVAHSFFPELRGKPSHFIDFTPKGVDRTRSIIQKAMDESPEFAWIIRTFGSVPIVSIDPDVIDRIRKQELLTGTQIGSEEATSRGIMGWSLSMMGIVLNTSSKPGRKRHPIGQRQRSSDYTYNENQTLEEFLLNTDLSMEGTLYHEWFHSFYSRTLGWHKALSSPGKSLSGLPGERADRQDYLFPGIANVDRITALLKDAFDPEGFIPYSSPDTQLVTPIISKARRKIMRNGDDERDFMAIMANHDKLIGDDGGLWTPEVSRRTLNEIQQRYPYLLDDLAPLLRISYGTASRQEHFAEGGVLFVTPDKRERSNYLPPELESIYAYVLGLKADPNPGDYDKPWEQRSGLASRSVSSQLSISTLNERVHTGKELFVQPGEAHRRPDVVKQSGDMIDVDVNGYKFSIAGELPEFQDAYGAWNDWQENWRMRYVSSEIMGLSALSPQSDTRRWQSITNNHLKNGTISEASSGTKDEIQRSAMMAISLMKEVADSPYASDAPLYRSINNVGENDAIASLNIGQTLSMPLTSFSPDYNSVVGFSRDDNDSSIGEAISPNSKIVVKLREGSNVVYSPVTKPTPDTDGREVNMPIEAITAGEFVVKSKTNVNGVDVVELEQSRVIDPILGSRATDGRNKVETNKRRVKLNQEMTKSLNTIKEKLLAKETATTDDEKNKIDDDISFEAKRYGTITRALRTRNDDFDKLDTPRTVGGLASSSSLDDRASRHGVSLDAFNDEGYDADDIEWSTNDWSLGKTNQVRAGDVVVVRTRNDGKKEILTIERKSGPFRGALSLPGGLQDEGEDLYDTAEREMLEEVNVSPTDAMDRRILGQVDVKDWDPRFVEGGRIAGIRFDLSEEQSSVVKAGDDAGKFNWVDVEEMSTGKYPIAFGHASWLAEAFADDEVLGPRFAVLAEASRVRNQRLIKKIDEKRREKGIKEFGEMPDPSLPYTTTSEGIRTGLASARSGVKDIDAPISIISGVARLMRDNEKFLNDNPISDAYYGRTIDGSWAKKMADDLKYGKISHEDAVGIYLALNAINDAKIYSSPESIEEAFAVRQALHKIRNTVSNSDDHYVRQYRRDGKTTWAAYRGSDYLGDYDSEEEALNVIQDSITDRTMIGPTKPAGLASTSRNTFSDTKSRYAESLDTEIADASDYLSRLEDALDEWNQTGVWKGEDYGVVITPGRPPRNMTREQMLEVNYNPDNFAGAVQSRIQELGLELNDMEASRSRLDKQGSNTTPIEAILDDPDVLARIEKRAEEVSAMSRPERSELFRDGEYEYVVHWGADVLEGGVLDPARSRGDETSASTVGNTRRINKVTAMQLVANRDDQKQKLSDLTKIQQEFEETGMVNLSSAENPFGVERLIGSLVSRGKDRNANYHGDRAYRPFPDKDDLNEMGIDELTPEMKENIATILERSRNGSEQTLARLDKVADKLIEDDYQYSSTYPAEKLQTANGYGGRYGEEGDSWKNDAPKATRTGIHVFRVRIGEDATRDTGGPDEVHIIGQHTPIASLSVETHRNAGHQPGSAQSTWQGWLAEVIEADKASRSGLASTANLTPEQSSVYTSIQQRVAGLASRGTPTNPIGKNTEEIAKEIDLSPEEMKILEQLIPNADKIADVDVNPALEGSADELLGSVRVTVGDDGIPFIYASPHPFLSEEIPDKRNWSAVIRPKKETLEKVKQLIDNLVKKSMGDDTPEEFWARSTGDGDKTEITDAFRDEARKLRTSFTTWAKDLLDNVTETKQEAPANNQFRLFDNMGQPTWLGMWAESLRDLASPNVLTFFGDNELTSHDVWGHLGTGRGFDRHGEWANMLAMFSLMDRWSEEKGISKEELVKLKASWFQSFEFGRVDGEFKPPAEQIRQEDKWYIKQWAIDSAFDFADTTDLEELISLIDDGNTHTGASKGLASTRGTELAEIAKIDIVRQSIKNNGAKNGLASTQLTPTDDIEEAKRTGRPVNMFRPGTLPPKTQAEYDAVLEQQMRNLEEAKELRKRYQEIWDRDPTPPYSDEEKDAIQASNKIRNELLFQFVDLTPLNRIMRDELKELGFDDETETRVRRAISDHLSVHISYFISGQYSQESTLGNEARLQHSVDALDKADIAVAFPKDLLEKLLEDGRFKTQFETKTSRGALHPEGRITGDIAQFGYHPDTAPEMRPVYGYLTSGGTIDRNMFGSIKQYGELQFILKRDSHSRSTYTTHDSLSSGLTPAPMGVPSKDASGKVGETMYAEAQIHGGLSLSDVDYVVVNVGEPDQNDWRNNKVSEEEFESISGMLARVGIRVVPVRNGEIADTWNGGKAIPEQPVEVVAQSQEPVKVVA